MNVAFSATLDNAEVRTRRCGRCYICGTDGRWLHKNVVDHYFGAPGSWSFRQCANHECGLIWLDPMPLEEDMGIAYQDYLTHEGFSAPESRHGLSAIPELIRNAYRARRYGVGPRPWMSALLALPIYLMPSQREAVDFPLRYIANRPAGRLLDVGCGDGSMLEEAMSLGWSAEGVDFDSNAVANARSKGLEVHLGAVEDLNLPDASFDLILMSHLIEQVYDPIRLLRECRRLLTPGGKLIVATPNAESLGHSKFGANWMLLHAPRHLYLFNSANLAAMTRRAGFKKIQTRTGTRGADGVFFFSNYRTQPESAGDLAPSVIQRIRVLGDELWESALLKVRPLCGEELVLEAN
jgi:2-polyprenyl-3-methyl-5-hydroxy-6-metoxy-1,4-benzoquinol methylase